MILPMKTEDVRKLLVKQMAGKSLREFGSSHGLSAAYLSDVLRGNRNPGPTILDILGLEKELVAEASYRFRKGKTRQNES